MKKPLPTNFFARMRDLGLKLFLVLGIIATLTVGQAFSQTFATSECNCLNNATTPTNGQYGETIIINAGSGQNWTIVSATGFYSVSSPAPPGAPVSYLAGTVVPEIGSTGQYVLNGKRVTGQGWTVVFSNGVNNYTVSSVHSCNYPVSPTVAPSIAIQGDRGTCVGNQEIYRINTVTSLTSGLVWSVSGGIIIAGQNTQQVVVQWTTTPVTGTVSVNGILKSYPTQSTPCSFSQSLNVDVVSEVPEVLACNNLVNVSMNPSCEMFITPEMILQDMKYTNASYDLEIKDLQTDTIIPVGTLGYQYINKTLSVTVTHECSGNSCWGLVKIEDKSIPELICPKDEINVFCTESIDPEDIGFPLGTVFPESNITSLMNGRYRVLNFDPCSDITIQYVDDVKTNGCSNPYSSTITRNWQAVDNSGNKTSCTQIINVERGNIDYLVFPPNFDDVLGTEPSIEACSDYPTLPITHIFAGNPHPDFTGYPSGIECLNAFVDFQDTKLTVCGLNSYKILRRWTVIDHCTQNGLRVYTQTITVMDTQAPDIVAPAPFVVGSATHTCGGTIDVPAPVLESPECSTWDYTVSYKPVDESGDPYSFNTTTGVVRLPNRTYRITTVITNTPKIWIVYTATDVCGNISRAFTEVTITDTEQPIPVCDKTSIVALGDNGESLAGVGVFDDGSWDNCGISHMLVRRMNASTCDPNPAFGPEVKFCCSDIGTKVQVVLRVFDTSGNMNECMVETEVQDNFAPSFTSVPSDVTANCTEDFTNLSRFGLPTAKDNCSVTITETREDFINECSVGSIVRTFTATDGQGNSVSSTQTITVRRPTPFGRSNITFPANVNITGCADKPVDPASLPAGRQMPTWSNAACALVAADYEDVIFQYTSEACVKILRKWTVIDWCQRNPLIPGTGTWTEYQVIMVNNTTAPTITKGCLPADITITPMPTGCTSNVRVTATATDDCTSAAKLKWSYALDINNDGGTPEFTGNANSINQEMPYGTHKLSWTVVDDCGNVRKCDNIFTVNDTKAPSPYCISEIITVIMPTTKTITIWASDFDLGSFDNCTGVTASFSPTNRSDISRTIRCQDMTSQATDFTYRIYFLDERGNNDFCNVSLRVQDNNNACGFGANNGGTGNMISFAGNIYSSTSVEMTDLDVQIQANMPEFPRTVKTNNEGKFIFENLESAKDYAVLPVSKTDFLNGVSTLDLVLIQRHMLGIAEFNSPYKLIASDINKDNKVNTADLVELRKTILGIQEGYLNNSSWRFMDTGHQFTDPTNPYQFADKVVLSGIDYNTAGIDFMGIKIGDVNETATYGIQQKNTEGRSVVELLQNTVTGKSGQEVEVLIETNQSLQQFFGLQMSLYVSPELGTITNIHSPLQLENEHINWNMVDQGIVNLSWNDIQGTDISGTLATIKVKLTKDVSNASLIGLAENQIKSEIYMSEGNQILPYGVRIGQQSVESNEFQVYQNIPNPFAEKTSIGFVLPEQGSATLTVYDVTGKVIYTKEGQFEKGVNYFELDNNLLGLPGVMYYKVDSKGNSATRKMIMIK